MTIEQLKQANDLAGRINALDKRINVVLDNETPNGIYYDGLWVAFTPNVAAKLQDMILADLRAELDLLTAELANL